MNPTIPSAEFRPVRPETPSTPVMVSPRVAVPQPPSAPAAGSGDRRAWRTALLTAAALTVVGLAWYCAATPGFQSTDSAFVDGHRVALAAQAGGRVSAVLVGDNELVRAGQVVLRIDPADYQVKLEQAAAVRAQASSALDHAQAQLPVTEAAARQARAQVQVAAAGARKAADDLRRYRQLTLDSISQAMLEAAEVQDTIATAQVEAARQAAAAAAAQIVLARTAVTAAAANVRAADALVAQARLNLSYCELKAPVSGYVTRKNVEPGSLIQPGQPLLNLVSEELYVIANFKETQLTHLRPGQPVTVTVDTYPGLRFPGRVDSRMAGTGSAFALLPPENATGNFVKVVQRVPVKIVFAEAARGRLPRLAVGMSVIATVDVRESAASTQTAALNR